jgi:transcriptional regulator with XRE-family HTH domain
MTGTQVRELRVALRLDPAHFAQLLGVHPSTLYRWEAAGDVPVRVEPFQQQILAVLQGQVAAPRGGNEDLGETILKGLLVGGAMFGLFKLLEAAFSEDQPRRTRGAVARGKVPRAKSSPTRKRSPR